MICIFKIELENSDLADLGIHSERKRSIVAIKMDEVESLWPSDDKDTGEDVTVINLKSGSEYHVYLPFFEVLETWRMCIECDVLEVDAKLKQKSPDNRA